jgi:hypothetical protein
VNGITNLRQAFFAARHLLGAQFKSCFILNLLIFMGLFKFVHMRVNGLHQAGGALA